MAMRRDVAGTSGVNASFRVSCQSGHSSVQEGQAASPVTSVLYLRVSTIDQTTANQERELREVATRMGCDIVKVYKDHGISGGKSVLPSTLSAGMRRSASSIWSWLGASIGSAAAFKTLLPSSPSYMRCASIFSCTSRASRPSQASSTFTMSPIRPEAIRHARSHRGSHAKAALWCVGLLCAIYRFD
jgi:hypothetical protein